MRCSLARTLTLNPPLFLFDEPFGAVDEITRERLNEETQQLFVQEGFAGLFITHSIGEAVFMSTRVLVMSARPGRLLEQIAIQLPRPRTMEMMSAAKFGAYTLRIRSLLGSANGGSSAVLGSTA
jgi:NitT/TauT family transport system ATP-binding protein